MITWRSPGRRTIEVGTQLAVLAGDRALLDEVAVRGHADELDDATQLHLAPAAARLRSPQGRHERTGLAAQPLARLDERAQLDRQLGAAGHAVAFEALEPAVDPRQRLAQRPDELAERLLAALVGAVGGRAQRAELGAREREELVVVGPQRLARQGGELVAQRVRGLLAGTELGLRAHELAAQGDEARKQHERDERRAEHERR